jgi:hypothetical protein
LEIKELKTTLKTNTTEYSQKIAKLEFEVMDHIEKNTSLSNNISESLEKYQVKIGFFENELMVMKDNNEKDIIHIKKENHICVEQYKLMIDKYKIDKINMTHLNDKHTNEIKEYSIIIKKLKTDMILCQKEFENILFEKDEFIKSLNTENPNNHKTENNDNNIEIINEYENRLKILQDNYDNIETLYDKTLKQIVLFQESEQKMDETLKNQIEKTSFLNMQLEHSAQNQMKAQEKDTQIMILRQQVLTYVRLLYVICVHTLIFMCLYIYAYILHIKHEYFPSIYACICI